jgi:hypothetical protein
MLTIEEYNTLNDDYASFDEVSRIMEKYILAERQAIKNLTNNSFEEFKKALNEENKQAS